MTLEQQADLLAENLRGWENSSLKRIGRRIGKYEKMSLADVKAINNIYVVNQDIDAITKELAQVSGKNVAEVEKMYADLLEEQHLANKPLYDYRNKLFVPFAENKELQAIVKAYSKTTAQTMVNLSKTSALKILDQNDKVVGLSKYYTDVLDKAVMQVTTGATDFHTAMRESIIELGGSGMRVDYGGITRRLDTSVRQSILWGAKQTSVAYNEMIYDELGCDGYEIDWHSNPRPSHEVMQGKQYVVGEARTIDGKHYDSFEKVAEPLLNEYGCLHFKTPIICGISEPTYTDSEITRLNQQNAKKYQINGKEYTGYEVTQMQRRLETEIRKEKTIKQTAMASGDKKLVKDCNAKIKAYKGKYEEIETISGIHPNPARMSIPRKPVKK